MHIALTSYSPKWWAQGIICAHQSLSPHSLPSSVCLGLSDRSPVGQGLSQPPAQGLFVWISIQRFSGYGEKSIKSQCLTKAFDLLLN